MKRSGMMVAAMLGVGVLVLGVSAEQAEAQCYYYGVPTVPYYAVPPTYVYSAPPVVYAPPVVHRTYVAPVYVPRHYYRGPVYYHRPRGFGFSFSFHGHRHHRYRHHH